MSLFCLKYRKNTESEKPKIERAKKEIITLSWKCVMFNKKKQKCIIKQETSGLLSNVVVKTPLNNIQCYVIYFSKIYNKCKSEQLCFNRRYIHAWNGFKTVWIYV